LWIGTFHSLGYRYLTQVRKKKLEIILPVESNYYLRNIYKNVLDDLGEYEDNNPFKEVIYGVEKYRNDECSWEEATEYPEVCSKIYDLYQKEKKNQNIVDYTDILYMFADELRNDRVFSNKFEWVFVDEAQDNSKKQNEIADLLTSKNRILIGDGKQAIYLFRGAAPHLFKEKIKEADRVFDLAYNYRSSKEIIEFANALLPQMSSYKGQDIIPTQGKESKPIFIMCDNIANQIYKAIEQDIRNGVPLHEIAVLGRSIKPVSIANLQILLRQNSIPYIVRGGDDKLNAAFLQNYLSVLKSLLNPTQVSLTNALSLIPGVGPKTALKLAKEAVEEGDSHRVLELQTAKFAQSPAYKKYISLIDLIGNNKELLLRTLDFIHDHYLVVKYGKKDPTEPSNKRQIIFNTLYEYLLGYKNLMEGIDSLYVNEEDVEGDRNKIVISTIHQSKGLEWDSVHIANFNEQSIPNLRDKDEHNEARIEEEFCLAYVAITRARKKLRMYMSYMNGNHSQAKANKMSRFIKEIYKSSNERYFTFRALDLDTPESIFKERLYNKLSSL
jgi:DNA helicase-2/ATP-dependent DNA helicase PcrA